MSNHVELWKETLADLELTLARGTFDTHLRGSVAVSLVDEQLTVEATSQFNVDWLNERLNAVIARTATWIAGRPVEVTFVRRGSRSIRAGNEDAGADTSVTFYNFDILTRGYVTIPSYAIKFWLPLLGAEAFGVYLLLRAIYYNPHRRWTRTRSVYLQLLADTCGCHRQTLIGRDGKSGKLWNLQNEGIAKIRVTGNTKTRRYVIKVLNSLPLLTPQQLAKLPPLLQSEHSTFLMMAKLDKDEWEQLHLIKPQAS